MDAPTEKVTSLDPPGLDTPATDQRRVAGVGDGAFARRLALTLAAACGVIISWRLRQVELLLFGAVLFGVLFHAVAEPLGRRLRLSRGWALTLTVILFAIVLAGALWFFGGRLQAQAADLGRRLPPAWTRFRADLGATPTGAAVGRALDHVGQQAVGHLEPLLQGFAITLGQALLALLLMVVAGIYLGAQPSPYRQGVLRLLPRRSRPNVEHFLELTGELLRRWLMAEAAAMACVGVMTGLGLWAIGVPAAGALGLLGALGEFVPMVGVFVVSAPALLLAAVHGWPRVVWTIVILTVIHQIDGNVLQPLLQRGFNAVPPVVTLFALVGFGAFLGPLGLIFAMPLTLVCLGAMQVWLSDDIRPGIRSSPLSLQG